MGPVLYVVAASSLKPKHEANSYIKYADDTVVLSPGINQVYIQDEIANIKQWCLKSNLPLNTEKMKIITFVHNKQTGSVYLQLDDEKLRNYHVNEVNFLGIMLNNCLNMKGHIVHLIS